MLSVVLPSYNEEKMIPIATERLGKILTEAGIDYELLFIDDGSRDGTWREILCCSASDPHVVKGDCVVVIDCDLQHQPEKSVEMYRLW